MNVLPMPAIIEEIDGSFPLPSPIYKSDFHILGDEKMQFISSTSSAPI
jgi:hypothetical protein